MKAMLQKDGTGINAKDVTIMFRNYHKCFTGSEVVDWISSKLIMSRADSYQLALMLFRSRVFNVVLSQK